MEIDSAGNGARDALISIRGFVAPHQRIAYRHRSSDQIAVHLSATELCAALEKPRRGVLFVAIETTNNEFRSSVRSDLFPEDQMANTYTQIYIQIVFAVRGRQCLIPHQHKEELYKYTTGIVKKRGQKLIAIGGMPDHVHVFVGMTPTIAISDFVRDIKAGSSGFINEKKWVRGKFNWQEGFGAFSYSHSQIGQIARYIERQEEHHRKRSFKEEYLELLKTFAVEYDEPYLFEWIDDGGANDQVAPNGA